MQIKGLQCEPTIKTSIYSSSVSSSNLS